MKKKIFLLSTFGILFLVQEISFAQIPNITWGRGAGGIKYDYSNSVTTDGNGNIFITGMFYSPSVTFGAYTLSNPDTTSDVFIVKYDKNGDVIWAKSATGSYNNWGNSVTIDTHNNVYITGYFTGNINFGGTVLTSNDTIDYLMFLVKYDNNGNVLWARSAGGHYLGSASGNSCTTDAGDNVYITGSFDGRVGFEADTLSSPNGNNVFIVKYDSDGNEIWAVQNDGPGYAVGHGITTSEGADIYITGTIRGLYVRFGSYTLTPDSASSDIFLAKYDASGNCLWAHSAGGPDGGDEGFGVSSDADGSAYITGNFSSSSIEFGSYILTNADTSVLEIPDAFIAKYSAGGSVQWALSSNDFNFDEGTSIINDEDGNSYCTGFYFGTAIFGGDTITAFSGAAVFLVKISPAGVVEWAKSIDGANFDETAYGVTVTPGNDVYVTGYFESTPFILGSDTLINMNTSTPDVYLAKLSGTPLPNCHANYMITPDLQIPHHYFLTNLASGHPPLTYLWNWGDGTQDNVPYPSHTYSGPGMRKICLTITDSTGCISTFCDSSFLYKYSDSVIYVDVIPPNPGGITDGGLPIQFRIYPCPTSDFVKINFPLKATIEILDINGQIIKTINNNGTELKIDVSNLSGGVYIIKVKSDKGILTQKLIKQ